MKKLFLLTCCGLLAAAWTLCWNTPTAEAIKGFKAEFEAKYVKEESNDPKEQTLAEAFDKAGCNVCHLGGFRDREQRNGYGEALSELLDKEKDKASDEMSDDEKAAIQARIQAALEQVAKTKIDPDDPNSPTFADKLAAGELPDVVVKKLPKGE